MNTDVLERPPRRERCAINVEGIPVLPGSSAAVIAGEYVFTGSFLAFGEDLRLSDSASSDEEAVPRHDPLESQSRVLMDNLGAVLRVAGADIGRDVVRIWQWVTADYPADDEYRRGPIVWPSFHPGDGYVRVAREMMDSVRTSTGIGVRQLPLDGGMLAVEVMAALPDGDSTKAGHPAAKASPLPFVSTVSHGGMVTTAAGASDFGEGWSSATAPGEPSLVALDARVNPYIWLGEEIVAQTEWTLARLQQSAERAGTDLAACIHAEVTLLDPSDYPGFERVWSRWFPTNPPARRLTTGTRIVVKGVRVEIALTLAAKQATRRPVPVAADVVPPVGTAPHGMRAGDLLWISSRLPLDQRGVVPKTIRESGSRRFLDRPAYEQTRMVLEDLRAICESGGSSLADVVKVQLALADLRHLPDALQAWQEVFPVGPPALSATGMGGPQPLLAPGACVQLDAISWVPPGDSVSAREGGRLD